MVTIVLIIVVILMIYLALPSFMAAKRVLYPRRKTLDDVKEIHSMDSTVEVDYAIGLKKEDIILQSEFGYNIRAFVLYNPVPTEHIIIISHGFTCRSELAFRYLKIFHNMGYNVLFLDHRRHGETGGSSVSFGYYEKHDLAKAIVWAKEHFKGKVGLFGESMGAGISMQTVELADVDFLIEDCGYSEFAEEIRHQIGSVPGVFSAVHYPLARLWILLLGKYDVEKVSPKDAMKKAKMPVLVVHGTQDNYVPYYMADIIMKSIPHDNKRLYSPEAGHAQSISVNPAEYEKQIAEFLKEYNLYYGKKKNS